MVYWCFRFVFQPENRQEKKKHLSEPLGDPSGGGISDQVVGEL